MNPATSMVRILQLMGVCLRRFLLHQVDGYESGAYTISDQIQFTITTGSARPDAKIRLGSIIKIIPRGYSSKECGIYILRLNVKGTLSGLDSYAQDKMGGQVCFPHVMVTPCLVCRTLSFRASNDSPTN